MPPFCILFYANYTILATQRRGAMAQWPPPKYAPDGSGTVDQLQNRMQVQDMHDYNY